MSRAEHAGYCEVKAVNLKMATGTQTSSETQAHGSHFLLPVCERNRSSSNMEATESRKLPRVPENLLKKRKRYQGLKAAEAKRALEEKRKDHRGKQIKFIRLETLARNSRRKLRDDCRLRRMGAYRKKPPIPSNQKLAFVVRIADIQGISHHVLQTLRSLRLLKIFSGVFVKLDDSAVKMLQVVEPYVAWGLDVRSVFQMPLGAF
uniref:60S ribosomal protein L7-like 1 n=1 Tax=Leptobrachium leishanense TaxID=445787 RepID=A0A8C5QVU5_9ANUR